jgi:hypothetical protein
MTMERAPPGIADGGLEDLVAVADGQVASAAAACHLSSALLGVRPWLVDGFDAPFASGRLWSLLHGLRRFWAGREALACGATTP